MKKGIIILYGLLTFLIFKNSNIKAQVFNTKYFEDTKWASRSKDSSFFKADTVQLVKTIEDTYFTNGQGMDIPGFFYTDFVQLEFHKNQKLNLSTFNLEYWMVGTFEGRYTWQYIEPKNILNLCFNDTLLISFIPILNSEKKISIPSRYNGKPNIETIEISLIKKYCILDEYRNR